MGGWNDTNKLNTEIRGEKRVPVPLSRHKSLMDWPGIESGPAQGRAYARAMTQPLWAQIRSSYTARNFEISFF